jgi:superfamily II DNA or RNA helicase
VTPPSKHFIREIKELSRAANLEFRTYQAYAAREGVKGLEGGNLVLTLPQGTGKTFVSQLIAYKFLQANQREKVLVIAPTKELRQQYVRMASWMGNLSPRLVVLDFKEPLSGIRKQVRRMVEAADIVVTTPEMFTNRLEWLSASSFNSIRLCIMDEVDLWLIDDYTDPAVDRYHVSISELKTRLKDQGTHFLGLTASALSRRGRALLIDDLRCKELAPFHSSIVKWLPRIQIELVACLDPIVVARDDEISERSKNLWRRLNNETNGQLENHGADFWAFVKALSVGEMGPAAAALALALLDNERQRLQLFEDVPLGKEKVRKAAKLARRLRPSIIYCREIQLVQRLAAEPWRHPPAIAHSGLGDRYLTETLRFKSGDSDVLLMTRDLGKRGLDFPFAKSLTLVSPKSSPLVMDQELCRTRGQRRHRRAKTVYVLFYRETYEEEKMRRVLGKLVDIRLYNRFPKFILSRRWNKWLKRRPGLGIVAYISS